MNKNYETISDVEIGLGDTFQTDFLCFQRVILELIGLRRHFLLIASEALEVFVVLRPNKKR